MDRLLSMEAVSYTHLDVYKRQLLDRPRLPDELLGRVVGRGLAAEDFTFELLEDDMTVAPGNYHMGASRLRLQGFGLAQDDFGKGYSSLYSLISTPCLLYTSRCL